MPFPIKNTFYRDGKGKDRLAHIEVNEQTPTDTLITVTPAGGTAHKIKLAGPKSKVWTFTEDGYKQDYDFEDYWTRSGREAYNNREEYDKKFPGFWDKFIKSLFSTYVYQKGGNITTEEQKELHFALMGYVIATKKQPKNETELMQIAQALMELKDSDPKQYSQLVQLGQKQISKAKRGAKLDYIQRLKGKCAEGEELVYFAEGGRLSCKCQKKAKQGKKLLKKKCK